MKTTMTTKPTIRPCSVMARISAILHLLSAFLWSLWVFGAAGALSGDKDTPVDLLSPTSLPTIRLPFFCFLVNGRQTARKEIKNLDQDEDLMKMKMKMKVKMKMKMKMKMKVKT